MIHALERLIDTVAHELGKDPIELRRAIAYVPQHCQLFHGTIAQNLRLAEPTASDQEIIEACKLAEVWTDIEELPDGLETRIGDQKMAHLPSGSLPLCSSSPSSSPNHAWTK